MLSKKKGLQNNNKNNIVDGAKSTLSITCPKRTKSQSVLSACYRKDYERWYQSYCTFRRERLKNSNISIIYGTPTLTSVQFKMKNVKYKTTHRAQCQSIITSPLTILQTNKNYYQVHKGPSIERQHTHTHTAIYSLNPVFKRGHKVQMQWIKDSLKYGTALNDTTVSFI